MAFVDMTILKSQKYCKVGSHSHSSQSIEQQAHFSEFLRQMGLVDIYGRRHNSQKSAVQVILHSRLSSKLGFENFSSSVLQTHNGCLDMGWLRLVGSSK